jgi:hypothetical protein
VKLMPWASCFKLVTSVCDACQRSFTTRHPSAHNIGIRMHDGWYCGARCFTAAAEKVMSPLLDSMPEPVHRAERMPLGLFLVSRNLINKQQLREATLEQKELGGEIGTLLVSRGVVSERQVASARATQWGVPLFVLPSHGVRSSIRLPAALVEVYSALPLHYGAVSNQLLVGFVHSIDYGLLYAIEHIVGCKTQPCFVTPSDFETERKVLQEGSPNEGLVFEAPKTPAAMARAFCASALDLEAHEAVIAKCRDYLWARLKREGEAADLLFRTR